MVRTEENNVDMFKQNILSTLNVIRETKIKKYMFNSKSNFVSVNNQRDAQLLWSIVIPQFLSALHISKESIRSSSGARHNILYYTVRYNRAIRPV